MKFNPSINAVNTFTVLILVITSAKAQTIVNSSPNTSVQTHSSSQSQMTDYVEGYDWTMFSADGELSGIVIDDINKAHLLKKKQKYNEVMECFRNAIRKLESRASYNTFYNTVYDHFASDPSLAPIVKINHGIKTVFSIHEQINSEIKQQADLSIRSYVRMLSRKMGEYAVETRHFKTALNILLPLSNPQNPDSASNLALSIACIQLKNYVLARKIFNVKWDLVGYMPDSKPYIQLKTDADLAGMIYLAACGYYSSDKNLHLRYARDAWRALPQIAYLAYTYAVVLQENSLHPNLQIRLFKSCKAGLQKILQPGISENIYYAKCQLDEQKSEKASSTIPSVSGPSSE